MTQMILIFKMFVVCAGIWTADNTLVWKDGVESIEYQIMPEGAILSVSDGENEMGYIEVYARVSGQSVTFYSYSGVWLATIYPGGLDIHVNLKPTR